MSQCASCQKVSVVLIVSERTEQGNVHAARSRNRAISLGPAIVAGELSDAPVAEAFVVAFSASLPVRAGLCGSHVGSDQWVTAHSLSGWRPGSGKIVRICAEAPGLVVGTPFEAVDGKPEVHHGGPCVQFLGIAAVLGFLTVAR